MQISALLLKIVITITITITNITIIIIFQGKAEWPSNYRSLLFHEVCSFPLK